ncbi:MAG TPA: TonB family protein [Thermoanaerobaculia bacterium]|nr:TonB family protein [Thermoanaerobaculia bacterium]
MPTGESKPKTASGVTPAPRRSGEIDLARLDELVKPSPRPAASRGSGSGVRTADDAFRTQRLETLRPAPPAAPREFGQYTLLDRVAVGGMAEVWKARMKGVEGFQKTVAIKKILSHLTDSVDFVTMFIDEAKLAAQLTHDNIIHIYDLGKIGEDYYIAMEYVDGKDLRSILNAARAAGMPLPAPLALFIAARLASALDHAHRKRDFENRELGLVHRDVSPQNVLVGYEGEIKLCDFGIVKAVTKASKTQMGALKGKLQYMSPEQAWGKPVDARSDLFSLGAILFEMLTGRRLFAGDNEISVLESVREGRIDRPRDVNPAVAPEVDALVVRALAKDPDERFQSAGEMQRELERLLSALRPAPTQSDLAAFLRGLFGDPARAAAAAPAGAPAATRAVVPAAPPVARQVEPAVAGAEVEAVAPAFGASLEAEGEGRGKRLLVAAIAAAIALGVALWLVFGRSRPAATSGPQSAPAVSTEPAPLAPQPVATELAPAQPPPAAAAAGGATGTAAPTTAARVPAAKAPPGAAAPAADLQTRVDQEVARREAEMRQKLEADRRRLEEQVAEARAAAEAPPPAPPAAAEPAAPPPPQEAAPPEPAASEPVPSEPAPAPASEPAPGEPSAPPPSEPASAEPAPPPAPAPVEPPAPSAPSVAVGELVRGGPGVRPPVLVTVPKPGYPPIAQRMRVQGVVTVEVLVDEDGNVRDSRLVKRVAQDVGLNEAALAAARKARFKPATKEGVRVRMWYTLTFPFQL